MNLAVFRHFSPFAATGATRGGVDAVSGIVGDRD